MLPKVLIAEDDVIGLEVIRDVLELNKGQLEVICTCNGREAIAELKRQTISLLITDIKMPEIDGLELLAFVRGHYPKLPCIAITAYAKNLSDFETIVDTLHPDIMTMIKNDSLRFFSKPFSIDILSQTVLKMLAEPVPDGTVQGITIASFIQLVELEQKTCMIEVYTPSNNELGSLFFKDGVLFDAACGTIRGEEAAIRIIAIDNALIRFKKISHRQIEKRINVESISLILEAIRRKDELNDISHNVLADFNRIDGGNRNHSDDLSIFESDANHLDKLLSKIKKKRRL
ncbi:response regulator [Desulfococcaceae bacterium HSG9]|nr:response regulator [Desulfococcaceae bacterium HSG9]